MKLLWLDLNSSYAHASLALPALHAHTLLHPLEVNVEWDVLSTTLNENLSEVVTTLIQRKPDVIAATCWLFTRDRLVQILSRIHALLPHCKIVLGGPEFLGNNRTFLEQNPCITAVFRGEGEEVFSQWLNLHEEPSRWHEISGICYCSPEGGYHDGGMARVSDFESLLPPEESTFFDWSKPFVQLETTRGCFNRCAFCVSGGDKPVRLLPLTHIAERLQAIQARGIGQIRLIDRTFNYAPQRAIALLELFRSFSPHLSFHLEMHPALLPESLRNVLRSMPHGLLHLEAGIQSLRPDVLALSGRAGGVEEALDGLAFLSSLEQMECHADLIAGLPHYTYPHLVEDVLHLISIGVSELQLESLKLLPGTRMRADAERLGLTYSPLPPYEVLQTSHLSAMELRQAMLLSRLLDNYYNTEVWHALFRYLVMQHPNFMSHFLAEMEAHGELNQPLSQERRGLILYHFCKEHYASELLQVEIAWIEAGLSLNREPAARLLTKRRLEEGVTWKLHYGEYRPEEMRFAFLPLTLNSTAGYWFGFEKDVRKGTPCFKAYVANS